MKNKKIKKIFLFIIMIGAIGALLTGYTKLYNSQKISTSANIKSTEAFSGNFLAAATNTVEGECTCSRAFLSGEITCTDCDKSIIAKKCNGDLGEIKYICTKDIKAPPEAGTSTDVAYACKKAGGTLVIKSGKYNVTYSATCTTQTEINYNASIDRAGGTLHQGSSDFRYSRIGDVYRWTYSETTNATSVTIKFPTSGSKTDHSFGGIFTEEDCQGTKLGTSITINANDSTKKFHACWRPNSSGVETPSTITATFVPNGGKLSADSDTCSIGKIGDFCPVTFPKATPPSGKKLAGWSLDSCNNIKWKASETSGEILDDIPITACWTDDSSSSGAKVEVPVAKPIKTEINKTLYVSSTGSDAWISGAVGNYRDKVYVTTCDNIGSDAATCIITSINGVPVKNTTLYYKYLSDEEPKEEEYPLLRYAHAGAVYYQKLSELNNNSNPMEFKCNTELEFYRHPTILCDYGEVVPGTDVKRFCMVVYKNDENKDTIAYVDRTMITGEEVVCMPEETEDEPDENDGGNTGGNTGGSTGGKTGGNTGGSTGGKTGGNTGGSTGGKTGSSTSTKTTCKASKALKNQTTYDADKKSIVPIKRDVCYEYDGKGNFKVNGNDEREIFKCASGYRRVITPDPVNNSCKDLSGTSRTRSCFITYKYTCHSVDRPKVHGTGSLVTPDNVGTISIKGTDSSTNTGLKGYIINNGEGVTEDSKWQAFENSEYIASVQRHAGHHFAWVMTNDQSISYPIMLRIYSDDVSTTAEITAKGPNDDLTHTLKPLKTDDGLAYLDGVTSQEYVRLSNQLMKDSMIATGFDLFTTAYELTVESDKIALYATLTSSDAKYVEGYEPRTIDLDYGRNVAIIKIENSKGAQRSYTFIINRTDTRESVNALKDVTLSVGKINFDPYVSDYTVSVPKNTKSVNINGILESDKSAFIAGYEPRAITINEDITSAVLKTISEAGITRNYVFTFIKTGAEEELNISNSAYLSFLSIPGTEIYFDKENLSYSVSVEYATESVKVYALPESDNAIVEINGNLGLKVGANKIEIIVTNGSVTKIYNVFINRKEDGLGVSSDTKLETLTVKDYDINFRPDVQDYILKIKREKTLLLTATPASDRSEVYMYGNNDLTAFSTVRIKVIAENGDTGLYSVDIIKDVYNKQLETTVAIVGSIIILGGGIIIMVNKKRKKLQDYIEE